PNLRQGIQWLAESWDEMKAMTIANCWSHAQILPQPAQREQGNEESSISADMEIHEVNEEFAKGVDDLTNMLVTLGIPISAQDYLAHSFEEEVAPYIMENDILEALVGTAELVDDDDDDVADVAALDAARVLVKYFRKRTAIPRKLTS